MKRFYIIFFSCIGIILCVLFFGRNIFFPQKSNVTTSRIVIPAVENTKDTSKTQDKPTGTQTNVNLTAFVPMASDETLIATHSADLNGDSFEDQVIAVKKSSSPYINLIVGLYNPEITVYFRNVEISTEIVQVKTFSCYTLDITGERINTLIYTGFTENNESVLQAFNGAQNEEQGFYLEKIADLKSSGTIFIESVTRTDAYAMSLVNGDCYPIWVYGTDEEDKDNFVQIQTRYKWNPQERLYLKDYETRVTGKKLVAKELQRIQDGTVETFMEFLEGLWYRTSSKTNETRYLFFDREQNEIIFLFDQTQEIYTITNSTLRRNGIYMSTANKSISNLTRRLDISLMSTDTIRIKLKDDLRMVIGEETVWDGNYKKMTSTTSQEKVGDKKEISYFSDFLKTEKNPWSFQDGITIEFKETTFDIQKDGIVESGVYSTVPIGDSQILQCRSNSKSLPSGFYDVKSLNDGKKTGKKIIELLPVSLNTEGFFPSGKPSIRLETESN